MTRVLEYGAKRHGLNNWKKGFPVTEIIESNLRHLHAILRGEDIDKESGLPNVDLALTNSMFYLTC